MALWEVHFQGKTLELHIQSPDTLGYFTGFITPAETGTSSPMQVTETE
jgi:hypothetical protein